MIGATQHLLTAFVECRENLEPASSALVPLTALPWQVEGPLTVTEAPLARNCPTEENVISKLHVAPPKPLPRGLTDAAATGSGADQSVSDGSFDLKLSMLDPGVQPLHQETYDQFPASPGIL